MRILESEIWNLGPGIRSAVSLSSQPRLLSVSGASLKRLTLHFKRLRPSQVSIMPVFIDRLLSVSPCLKYTPARAETRRFDFAKVIGTIHDLRFTIYYSPFTLFTNFRYDFRIYNLETYEKHQAFG